MMKGHDESMKYTITSKNSFSSSTDKSNIVNNRINNRQKGKMEAAVVLL